MTDCMGIPLILREVLQHFSTTDLLQLSLVNKLWNYEARSLIRSRGDLSANINQGHACQDLRAFASDLQQMKETKRIIPFTGMTVSIGGLKCDCEDWSHQLSNKELDPAYEEILTGLTFKHLWMRISLSWKHRKHCPGLVLVKKILENFAWAIEEFTIELEWDVAKYFADQFIQASSFSRLKTFRLISESETEAIVPEYTGLIKTVVARAPNLQVFYSTGEVDLYADLMEGSSALHVAGYPYSICEIPESVPSDLRLQKFRLYTFPLDSSLKTFNGVTSTLLQSSRTTLTSIGIDIVFLLPLMVYGICLANVRTFEMSVDLRNLQKRQLHIWKLVADFDFTRMFPNLDTVSIIYNSYLDSDITDEFNAMVEQVNGTMKSPMPDRAVNIKYLKLQHLPARVLRRRSAFRLLSQMFPDVQKLSIEGTEMAYDDIRDVWLDLKEVHVKLHWSERRPINLDSVFCGIFPPEVAHLREKDEEYLRSVNIVPVMPSICYLKELRSFTVSYDEHDNDDDSDSYLGPTDKPTCTFSKVAGFIAIQRCPDLTVTLTMADKGLARALSHLRPYASVVLEEKTSV